MTVLPETDVARVRRWCRARVPDRVRDQIRVEAEVAQRHVTIVECRPPWGADMGSEWTRFPIAVAVHQGHGHVVTVLARPESKFHVYDRTQSTANIEESLTEVDSDPTAIFWG